MNRLALVLLFGALPLAAQNSSLVGTITDAHGASVPDAVITAKNVDTSAVRTTIANNFGSYELVQVPPGKYSVTMRRWHLSR